MYFRDDSKRPVDQGHREVLDRQKILQQGRLEREKRQLQKRQEEGAKLIQRHLKGFLAFKTLKNSLEKEEQVMSNT